MSKWRVDVPAWSVELEAADEGDALCQADSQYSFMNEATAEEVEFKLPPEQWRAFLAALDKPAESHPALRRLLTEPSVIELAIRQAPRYSEEAVTELLAVAEKVCLTDKGYPKAGLEVLRDALRKVQGERGSKA